MATTVYSMSTSSTTLIEGKAPPRQSAVAASAQCISLQSLPPSPLQQQYCRKLARNVAVMTTRDASPEAFSNAFQEFIKPLQEAQQLQTPSHKKKLVAISRRSIVILIPLIQISNPQQSLARERRNKKAIPLEDYLTSPDGLKYYDLVEGKGPTAEKGSTVQVHFDCVYNKITAVSSRESKILAGNRTIAQPYEFKVGAPPGRERKRDFVDNPNGLFSAQAAPKPPPAMYTIVEGMKVGGQRTVIVPPEAGYGKKGMNEIPPGATFQLNLELLQVMQPEGK